MKIPLSLKEVGFLYFFGKRYLSDQHRGTSHHNGTAVTGISQAGSGHVVDQYRTGTAGDGVTCTRAHHGVTEARLRHSTGDHVTRASGNRTTNMRHRTGANERTSVKISYSCGGHSHDILFFELAV
jgi:hypothetical protein